MRSAWRVACVRIPRFPIGAVWQRAEAARRAQEALQLSLLPELGAAPAGAPTPASDAPPADEPHWDDRPIALVDGGRLRAVTAGAGRLRVRAGMTVPEARARCAALEVLPWDDAAVAHALAQATAAFLVASPHVTPVAGAPGMWWVGAGGFDGIGGERGVARALLRLARTWHPRARVAVADSCVAARAAVWADNGDAPCYLVPRGGDAAYLAPAPLALLPMDDELRQALHALGLRTAGAFAALAAEDVERRWGAEGLRAWRLARGDDPRRPVLARPESERTASAELAMPATTMEPVLFLVRAALDRLVRELVADGRAAAAVAITLTLDDGRGALPAGGVPHTITREVRPARPLARVAPLFERCRALLDRWTLTAPVCGVTVRITATAPLPGEQGDLLAPAWRDPAAADAALERLRAKLGASAVVRPVSRDAHRLEKAGVWEEEGERGEGGGRSKDVHGLTPPSSLSSPPSDLPLALRLLETPERIEVEWAADVPAAVWWRGRRVTVAHADGPERLAGDWWDDPYHRDYWRCHSADGAFVIYRDGSPERPWYLQGWYD